MLLLENRSSQTVICRSSRLCTKNDLFFFLGQSRTGGEKEKKQCGLKGSRGFMRTSGQRKQSEELRN